MTIVQLTPLVLILTLTPYEWGGIGCHFSMFFLRTVQDYPSLVRDNPVPSSLANLTLHPSQ